MSIDRFGTYSDTVSTQTRRWAVVVPSDTVDMIELPKAIRVDGGGTIVLRGDDGHAESFTVSDGETLPFRPTRVLATGTTATGIKALF